MKPDPEFLKNVLITLQASDNPWPSTDELVEVGIEPNGNMLLHLEILADYDFIESKGQSESFGFQQGVVGDFFYASTPIRITAKGHEFIEAMEKPEVWEVIKNEFKESSIKTIFSVGRSLIEGLAKERLGKYLNAGRE